MSLKFPTLLTSPIQAASKSMFRGASLLLGAGASLLYFCSSAAAIESIVIRYQTEEVTVTLEDLEGFAGGASVPELEQLLRGEDPDIQDMAGDVVQIVRDALREEIRISPSFRDDVDSFLASSTGEFLLIQLDRVIGSLDAGTQGSITDLETAIKSSIDDGFISALELVQKFPQNTVRIEASSLSGVVSDVALFVQEIEPVLRTVRDVLQDIICECEPADVSSSGNSSLPEGDRVGQTCTNAHGSSQAEGEPEVGVETEVTADADVVAETEHLSLVKETVPKPSIQ